MKKILIIACAFILIYVAVIAIYKSGGKPLYRINVYTLNGGEVYTASSYKIDSLKSCITFKTLIGINRTVCGTFSITEY